MRLHAFDDRQGSASQRKTWKVGQVDAVYVRVDVNKACWGKGTKLESDDLC